MSPEFFVPGKWKRPNRQDFIVDFIIQKYYSDLNN